MVIRQININRFGALSGEQISFSEGLNIVYGPNESGKSTLQGFLFNMLFGMSRSRGKASKTDAFTRFEPISEPLRYSGSMTFECGNRTFVLQRDFAAGKRKDTLVSPDDGEILSVADGDLTEILGGISRQTYHNTQDVEQASGADRDFLTGALRDRYAQIAAKGEAGGSLSDAIADLSAKRKILEAKSRKIQKESDDILQRLELKIEYARTDIEEKRQELEKIRVFRKERSLGGPSKIKKDTGGSSVLTAGIVSAVIAVLLAVWMFLVPQMRAALGPVFMVFTAIAVIGIVIRILRRNHPPKRKAWQVEKPAAGEYEWRADYLRDVLREKEPYLEDLKAQYDQEIDRRSAADGLNVQIEGLKLAEETIRALGGTRSLAYERQFRTQIEQNYRALTGQPEAALLFEGEEIRIRRGNEIVPLWQCSKGTRDQVDLSVRLAAADMLIQEESMPILLDDAFVNYDDERLKRTLVFLAGRKKQVILFTCQRREGMLLRELQLPHYRVRWSGDDGSTA